MLDMVDNARYANNARYGYTNWPMNIHNERFFL